LFDIGWTEMLVVAVVAIVVVGPKDLPQMLRAFGKAMSGVRKMAGDFQKQFDDAVKEADLEDVKKIATGKTFKPLEDIKSSTEAFKKQVKEQMDASVLPTKTAPADAKLPDPAAAKKPAEAARPEPNTPEFFTGKTDVAANKPGKAESAAKKPTKKPASKPVAKATAKTGKPAKKKPAAGKKA
jgi:sec-independent protein translocase protein TatB